MSNNKEVTNTNITKFQTQQHKQRKQELQGLEFEEIVSTANTEKLNNLLRDKNIGKQEDFQQTSDKEFGVSAGYIGKERDTGNTFILKQFYKDIPTAINKDKEEALKTKTDNKWQNYLNARDGVQELLASGLYSLLLYDRAPKEELVIPDKANEDSLYVRSKFFKAVKSLDKFSGSYNTGFNPSKSNIAKLEGFEKVIAACNILGDNDYHAGNLMVQQQKLEDHENSVDKFKYVITKIDHGKSFINYNKDFTSLTNNLDESFKIFNYMENGQVKNLKFDITKYASAMEQMTKLLTDDQIDPIIDQKISELQKSGFNPKGLILKNSSGATIEINDYQQLSNHYKNELKTNLKHMQEISKDLAVVSLFSNATPEFTQGGWVKEFAESKEKNPVVFAVNHNIEIEGKNPLIWAMENNYKIHHTTDKQKNTFEKIWEKRGENWQEAYQKSSKTIIEKTDIDPINYLLAENSGKNLKDLPKSLGSFLVEEVYRKSNPEYKKYAQSAEKSNIKIPDDIKSGKSLTTPTKQSNFKNILKDSKVQKAIEDFNKAINTTPSNIQPKNNQLVNKQKNRNVGKNI